MFLWIGRAFAVFIGGVLVLYGLWILFFNIGNAIGGTVYDPWWILPTVLNAGLLAAVGGVLFVLSILRPRFRTRRVRIWSFVLMVLGSLLPTSLTPMLLVLLLTMLPTLFVSFPSKDSVEPVTSV